MIIKMKCRFKFNLPVSCFFLNKAKGVTSIPQNFTERLKKLQFYQQRSLKRGHPSEDKGDPWFLHEQERKKLIKPYPIFPSYISSNLKITPDNESTSGAYKGNIQIGNVFSALEYA